MERSSIKLLKKRENTNTQIAQVLGRDMKTVKRALIEPANKEYYQPKRGSLVDSYEESIRQWLVEGLPVTVMIQKAIEDAENPYQGGRSIFYQRVQLIRRELKIQDQKGLLRSSQRRLALRGLARRVP